MGSVLRIDHKADVGNAYAQAFRVKLVFRNFNQNFRSHNLIEAIDRDAARNHIETTIRNGPIDYISASGHGEYESFFGEDGLPIWEATPLSQHYLQSLSGKIVHLLSCDSGSYLGHMMVLSGAVSFWGYTSEFSFTRQKFGSPETDIDAEKFFEMDAIIDRGILSGIPSYDIYKDVSSYVANTVHTLPSLDRGIFLDNYMIIACPVVNWGSPVEIMV